MALIKIELDYPLEDGMSLTFKAPCDCTAVTGVKVYYPNVTEDATTTVNKTFSFRDTHLNALTNLGNLFMTGATVKVVVDTENAYAFIQNADTNAYLENKFSKVENHNHDAADIVSGVLSVARGGTGVTSLSELATALGLSDLPTTMGDAKIQSGSYVGTGSYGTNNKCSLTFNFAPKMVIITNETTTSGNFRYMIALYNSSVVGVCGNITNAVVNTVTWSGNTMTWYQTANSQAQNQMNSKDTYHWVALG